MLNPNKIQLISHLEALCQLSSGQSSYGIEGQNFYTRMKSNGQVIRSLYLFPMTTQKENKSQKLVLSLQSTPDLLCLDELFHHYSSYERLLRTVAWIIRFKMLLMSKHTRKKQPNIDAVLKSKLLSRDELENAEINVLSMFQRMLFNELITDLQNHFETSRNDKGNMTKRGPRPIQLRKLSPFFCIKTLSEWGAAYNVLHYLLK